MGYYYGQGEEFGGGGRDDEPWRPPGRGGSPAGGGGYRRGPGEYGYPGRDLGGGPIQFPTGTPTKGGTTRDDTDTTDAGEGCPGGYPLSQSQITSPGPGSRPAEFGGGWVRDAVGQGHYFFHEKYGWHDWETAEKQVQQGIEPSFRASVCPKNMELKNIDGVEWCCPSTEGYGAGAGGDLGWWDPPPEMQEYYKNLMGRGQEFLDMPLGFTPEMINKWFGKDFDLIRGMERPLREQAMTTLGREGMLGTGAVPERMGKIAWDVEGGISDLSRDIFMESEMQKKRDIKDYSSLSQSIFGTGMGYNQLIEAINASRRGERQAAMDSFFSWLAMMSW